MNELFINEDYNIKEFYKENLTNFWKIEIKFEKNESWSLFFCLDEKMNIKK